MNLGIAGRSAIVRGGSAGLGRGVAEALAADGVNVLLAARSEDWLRQAADEIGATASGKVRRPALSDHGSSTPLGGGLTTSLSAAGMTTRFRPARARSALRSARSWSRRAVHAVYSEVISARVWPDTVRCGCVGARSAPSRSVAMAANIPLSIWKFGRCAGGVARLIRSAMRAAVTRIGASSPH